MSFAHLHLLINHLPIIGAFLALPLLALALATRQRGALAAAALTLALAGVGALGAQWTGEPAEAVVEDLPGFSKAAIHEHEERAEIATVLALLAALAGAGAVALERSRGLPAPAAAGLVGLSLLSAGAMAYTGAAGGAIRHTELSAGESSTVLTGAGPGEEEGYGDDDDDEADEID